MFVVYAFCCHGTQVENKVFSCQSKSGRAVFRAIQPGFSTSARCSLHRGISAVTLILRRQLDIVRVEELAVSKT